MTSPPSTRAIQVSAAVYSAAYLIMALATAGAMVALLVPDFRYWLMVRARELEYRIALMEYRRRHAPVPGWVELLQDGDLPHEE